MKKVLLVMAALFCVATASAGTKVKDLVNLSSAPKCSVGLRVGTVAELAVECFYSESAYLEGRLGYAWKNGFGFTALHVWNPCNWNWTPQAGSWFLDAGAGAFVGGSIKNGYSKFGVAGVVKFGIFFKKVPIRLAVDLTPHVGIQAWSKKYNETGGVSFFGSGIFNSGISATYCF